jgi:hypothetical protein
MFVKKGSATCWNTARRKEVTKKEDSQKRKDVGYFSPTNSHKMEMMIHSRI